MLKRWKIAIVAGCHPEKYLSSTALRVGKAHEVIALGLGSDTDCAEGMKAARREPRSGCNRIERGGRICR